MASTQVEIIVRLGPDTIQRRLIGPGEYFIGCDPSCQLHLEDDSVSHKHARLCFDGERFVVEDLGSTNGTFLDGVRLTGRVPIRLGQQLQIGQSLLELAPLSGSQQVRVASAEDERPVSADKNLLSRRHYETGREVARGGMGAIHEAEDLSLRRRVALKVMLAGNQATREAALRFEREARVLAQLEHPNIVPIHDLGLDEQGRVFYTMKFVKGVTLKNVLEEIKAANSETIAKYPLTNLLTVFQKVCDAVSFAHSKGVIHRDLKPANIMLGEFGEVLVMDWGLAKLINPPSSSSGLSSGLEVADIETLHENDQPDQDFRPLPIGHGTDAIHTLEGSIMGSPQFMAPEQAEGRISYIGECSDIYALGGILYNILTLLPPVTGESAHEILEKIREDQITPPSSTYNKTASPPARRGAPTDPQPIVLVHCPGRRIPDALSAVTMKALALHPEHRYQTVAELQKDIAAYQGGFATSAEQAGAWKLLSLAIKRRRTEFSVAAAGLMIIGVMAASFMWKVTSTLGELRRTAPTFHHQALALIEEQKFEEALQRIAYALTLAPKEPEFHVLKGNLLQSLLNLPEAREAYARAVRLKPNHE
jgi:eukaryotic-like serine/threonine-protein kinase